MEIEEWRDGTAVVLFLKGRLDGVGAPLLEARVAAIAGSDAVRVVLDCSRITYLGSAGLRALLICARACQQGRARLAIAALRPECRMVVDVSGLLLVLDYHETSDAALAALERGAADGDREFPPAEGGAGMEIEETTYRSAIVLSLVGRLGRVGAADLEARVAAIARRGGPPVVLDCGRMTYINSAGLRAFLICARTCLQQGGTIAVAALRPPCRSVVDMSGFLSVIECRETRDAALAAIA